MELAFECPELSATEESVVPGCRAPAKLLGSPQQISQLCCFLKAKNKNKSKARRQKKSGEGVTVPVVSIPDKRGNSPCSGVQKPKF